MISAVVTSCARSVSFPSSFLSWSLLDCAAAVAAINRNANSNARPCLISNSSIEINFDLTANRMASVVKRCKRKHLTCVLTSLFFYLPLIANCDTNIAIRHMTLGEKLRYLRQMEGTLRGLDRELTQQELV